MEVFGGIGSIGSIGGIGQEVVRGYIMRYIGLTFFQLLRKHLHLGFQVSISCLRSGTLLLPMRVTIRGSIYNL